MNEDEKQALARKMWDKAHDAGTDDPEAMKNFLFTNKPALKHVLGDKHVDALENIQKALEMDARTRVPAGQKEVADPFGTFTQTTGLTPQQLLSRSFAVASGRVGKQYTLGTALISRYIKVKQTAANDMMKRAIYDPDFAEQLANYVATKAPTPKQVSKFKGYMYTSGINGLTDEDEPDEIPTITIRPQDAQ
jgi:hypothetical protein